LGYSQIDVYTVETVAAEKFPDQVQPPTEISVFRCGRRRR